MKKRPRRQRREFDGSWIKVHVIRRSAKKFLRVRWEDQDGVHERSTKTTKPREAYAYAERLEEELNQLYATGEELSWTAFRQRYEAEKQVSLSPKSRAQWKTAVRWLEKLVKPDRVVDLSASRLSVFSQRLRESFLAEASIASYLIEIRSALHWAERMDLISQAPRIDLPKRGKGRSKSMRSRPITAEEFDRLMLAVTKVRPTDPEPWQRFLRGLWHSGFRVGELLSLSWDPTAVLAVDTSQAIPLVRIYAEGEKSHQDRYQPITPEFWTVLRETPEASRHGSCFPLHSLTTGNPLTPNHVIRIVGKIGKQAHILTEPTARKYATSHDIGRRAFGTRMGAVLSPLQLTEWMRHASVQTTLSYYHAPKALDLAQGFWTGQGDPYGDPVTLPTEERAT